ncbi:MAG TPA: 50S ribosomal protein L10 [Devosiaceae bacterium]|nr:50S ribosomal protein L10 [Devosiaceae bacterium]
MDRAEKRELVADLSGALGAAGTIVVAHYEGLSVAEMEKLRKQMKQAGGSVRIAKNRLAKRALKDTEVADISGLLTGPTLLAFSADPVTAAKVAAAFAKTNDKLVIVGGAMGVTELDADGVKALAELPSLDELRARLAGMLTQPAARIAAVLQAPGAQVARVISAYSEQGATA